jgi:lipopolysaccharide/colanic/teichoic acid biosynthesis glycosyltransferase
MERNPWVALKEQIEAKKPFAVGITASTAGIENAVSVARRVRAIKPRIIGIIGGWHASVLPEETLMIGILIKIDSPGPAIFRQIRVGHNRRAKERLPSERDGCLQDRRKEDQGAKFFTFYKFRTMVVDAKERFPELYRYQYSPEEIKTLYFKVPGDPRLTELGRHLRKTTLDELPNLINVLKGDMSLVGP